MFRYKFILLAIISIIIVSCSTSPTGPTATPSPVQGSVKFGEGFGNVPLQPGGLLQMKAYFEASSAQGQVTEMRALPASTCQEQDKLDLIPWESFRSQKEFNAYNAHKWKGFAVSVQYRDEMGNVSPIYCVSLPVFAP